MHEDTDSRCGRLAAIFTRSRRSAAGGRNDVQGPGRLRAVRRSAAVAGGFLRRMPAPLLIIAAAFVALLAISTGTALAGPSMQMNMPGVTISAATPFTLTKPVTVTGVNDDIDNASDSREAMITHTVMGADYATGVMADSVSVDVTDDDTHTVSGANYSSQTALGAKGIQLLNPNNLEDYPRNITIEENGAPGNNPYRIEYRVRLASQPTGPVTITTTREPIGDLSISINHGAASMTFTQSNWDTPQDVVITAIDDDIDEGTEVQTITHSASGADYATGVADQVLHITIIDNDRPGVTIEPTAVAVTEAAGANHTAEYSIGLNSQPTDNVTFTFGGDEGGDFVISPNPLVFILMNWRTAQIVTVTATDDFIDEVDLEMHIITHTVSGGDYGANNVMAPDVTVTITDNDTAGVTVSKTVVTVSEDGATDSYTIKLDSRPFRAVTISVTSGDTGNVTVDPTSLTFMPDEWDTAQTVMVTAVNDDVDDDDNMTTITHRVEFVDRYGYFVQSIASVTATAIDNDAAPGLPYPKRQ